MIETAETKKMVSVESERGLCFAVVFGAVSVDLLPAGGDGVRVKVAEPLAQTLCGSVVVGFGAEICVSTVVLASEGSWPPIFGVSAPVGAAAGGGSSDIAEERGVYRK